MSKFEKAYTRDASSLIWNWNKRAGVRSTHATEQSRNLNIFRKYHPGPPLQGGEETGGEEREWERRRDDVTDRGKGPDVEYLEFSTPHFIPMCRNC